MKLVGNVELGNIKKIKSGKIREMFSLGDRLLIVTTDRISAFDYILPSLIPGKGILLNQISIFWFNYLSDVIENHLLETEFENFPKELKKYKEILKGRSVLVKKANIYPIECVVRGYITGSAWEEYKVSGKVGDFILPENLKFADKLPEPIFTPTTKEVSGHDLAITLSKAKKIFGTEVIGHLQDKSVELYKKASQYALKKGIIIADTKFEFGNFEDRIIIADEVLTPDSSRFWFLEEYVPGQQQKSMDKQFVRDYLLKSTWDRNSVPPGLPEDIINHTSQRYIDAYEKITGKKFNEF
ncbi:MAG: phosphoribosylaminoimidazolesuccinocarboxamide synthase [Actinobacteria bacterium]|nr:phosphoribosylaminoimidazolesuccinocarboxamide synthase [Actinomycetota bacterium]